jgi:hypothetical protein
MWRVMVAWEELFTSRLLSFQAEAGKSKANCFTEMG